jgi:hypothetical protein
MSPTLISCQPEKKKSSSVVNQTTNINTAVAAADAGAGAADDDDCTAIEGIRFVDYVDESQLHHVMNLVGRDLSEPYSGKNWCHIFIWCHAVSNTYMHSS